MSVLTDDEIKAIRRRSESYRTNREHDLCVDVQRLLACIVYLRAKLNRERQRKTSEQPDQ